MKSRPDRTQGTTHVILTGCGKLYATIAQADSYQEVFLKLGKAGGCPAAWLDGMGRLITFALNEGVEVEVIVKALIGIRCPSPQVNYNGQDREEILSCPDAIARVLKEWKEEKGENI